MTLISNDGLAIGIRLFDDQQASADRTSIPRSTPEKLPVVVCDCHPITSVGLIAYNVQGLRTGPITSFPGSAYFDPITSCPRLHLLSAGWVGGRRRRPQPEAYLLADGEASWPAPGLLVSRQGAKHVMGKNTSAR